jgi:DNA (cytosine-5)-methyltransferase 1
MTLKILNLYAGIGGNRKLWDEIGDFEITAVEYKQEIADIYHDFFPKDKIVVADAHQYLLDHYKEYDFVWSSPPCPTHSDIRRCGVHKGQYEALYPDMTLYQEIILLKHFANKNCKWVVENVKPYYEPLIKPTQELHRHFIWSNFYLQPIEIEDDRVHNDIVGSTPVYGFDLKKYKANDKRKLLRNMVNPELGKYILECALGLNKQKILL